MSCSGIFGAFTAHRNRLSSIQMKDKVDEWADEGAHPSVANCGGKLAGRLTLKEVLSYIWQVYCKAIQVMNVVPWSECASASMGNPIIHICRRCPHITELLVAL